MGWEPLHSLGGALLLRLVTPRGNLLLDPQKVSPKPLPKKFGRPPGPSVVSG